MVSSSRQTVVRIKRHIEEEPLSFLVVERWSRKRRKREEDLLIGSMVSSLSSLSVVESPSTSVVEEESACRPETNTEDEVEKESTKVDADAVNVFRLVCSTQKNQEHDSSSKTLATRHITMSNPLRVESDTPTGRKQRMAKFRSRSGEERMRIVSAKRGVEDLPEEISSLQKKDESNPLISSNEETNAVTVLDVTVERPSSSAPPIRSEPLPARGEYTDLLKDFLKRTGRAERAGTLDEEEPQNISSLASPWQNAEVDVDTTEEGSYVYDYYVLDDNPSSDIMSAFPSTTSVSSSSTDPSMAPPGWIPRLILNEEDIEKLLALEPPDQDSFHDSDSEREGVDYPSTPEDDDEVDGASEQHSRSRRFFSPPVRRFDPLREDIELHMDYGNYELSDDDDDDDDDNFEDLDHRGKYPPRHSHLYSSYAYDPEFDDDSDSNEYE